MNVVVIFVVLACLHGIPSVLAQNVGDTCPEAGCAANVETCNAATKCECATDHINKGTKTCISNDCSATGDATTCNGLANFACVNNVCGCDAISSPVTADGATKGTCAVKACTANGNECGSDVTIECDTTNSLCACASAHTLGNGVCEADSIGGTCSSDASCAGITDAVCDTMATASVCKLAVGKTCTTTTDNCVTNGECDSTTTKCKCKTNYVADSSGNLCTAAQSSAGMIAASVGALLLTLFLQVSLL